MFCPVTSPSLPSDRATSDTVALPAVSVCAPLVSSLAPSRKRTSRAGTGDPSKNVAVATHSTPVPVMTAV